jgi:hypothetical protein
MSMTVASLSVQQTCPDRASVVCAQHEAVPLAEIAEKRRSHRELASYAGPQRTRPRSNVDRDHSPNRQTLADGR